MADHSKLLAFIAQCADAPSLRSIISRARERGEHQVADTAWRKLISLVPHEKPGTLEYEFWMMINVFEESLKEERGKTVRLGRTRPKVARDGILQTLNDWALAKKETTGFRMLLERGMPEYTGEAIVLRHANRFTPEVVHAARMRLVGAGLDPSTLPAPR